MTKTLTVPYDFLEECAEKYCAQQLSESKPIPKSKFISWRKRTWICVAGTSQGLHWLDAELRQVVPQEKFRGIRYCDFIDQDKEQHAVHYYTGDVFICGSRAWCITANEITIVAKK
jgi:hypothetical protein